MGNAYSTNSNLKLTDQFIKDKLHGNLDSLINYFDSNYLYKTQINNTFIPFNRNFHFKTQDFNFILLGDSHTQVIEEVKSNNLNSVKYAGILGMHNVIPFLKNDADTNTFVLTETNNIFRPTDISHTEESELSLNRFLHRQPMHTITTDTMRSLSYVRFKNLYNLILYAFSIKFSYILIAHLYEKCEYALNFNDPIKSYDDEMFYGQILLLLEGTQYNEFKKAIDILAGLSFSSNGIDELDNLMANGLNLGGKSKKKPPSIKETVNNLILYTTHIVNSRLFKTIQKDGIALYANTIIDVIVNSYIDMYNLISSRKDIINEYAVEYELEIGISNAFHMSVFMDIEVLYNLCCIYDLNNDPKTIICHFGDGHFRAIISLFDSNLFPNPHKRVALNEFVKPQQPIELDPLDVIYEVKQENFTLFKFAMYMYRPNISAFISDFNLEKLYPTLSKKELAKLIHFAMVGINTTNIYYRFKKSCDETLLLSLPAINEGQYILDYYDDIYKYNTIILSSYIYSAEIFQRLLPLLYGNQITEEKINEEKSVLVFENKRIEAVPESSNTKSLIEVLIGKNKTINYQINEFDVIYRSFEESKRTNLDIMKYNYEGFRKDMLLDRINLPPYDASNADKFRESIIAVFESHKMIIVPDMCDYFINALSTLSVAEILEQASYFPNFRAPVENNAEKLTAEFNRIKSTFVAPSKSGGGGGGGETNETYLKLERWIKNYKIDASDIKSWPTGLSQEIAYQKFKELTREDEQRRMFNIAKDMHMYHYLNNMYNDYIAFTNINNAPKLSSPIKQTLSMPSMQTVGGNGFSITYALVLVGILLIIIMIVLFTTKSRRNYTETRQTGLY